jgi:para-aminobenzoate synthetase/4-amino-4-deoxychorismate lyase
VRLCCFRDGRLTVDVSGLPPAVDRPVLLAIDDEPIDSRSFWPYHKTSRREPYVRRRDRHQGVDDVVLVNERGEVTETTIANLAVQLDGRWWTPPADAGCLPGIERGRLLDSGVLAERVLYPDDLRRAPALALVSSLRGWRPAKLSRG